MERAGRSVAGASHHPDLADLVRQPGPFLSVWAGGGFNGRVGDVPGASAAMPAELLEEVSTRLAEQLPGGEGTGRAGFGGAVCIATRDGIAVLEHLPGEPRAELASLDPLPRLSPLIEHRQGSVPFLLLTIDRRGADLFWSDGQDSGTETIEAPEDLMIQKFKDSDSGPGFGNGYREHDFQRKVEQNWSNVAADVAKAVADRAAVVKPRVVSVAGDVRMVQFLREHLPPELSALTRDAPGSRSEDGSDAIREDANRRWIKTAVAEETVEVLRVFERERGQHDRAADGPAATCAALCEARVDVLLVHDDPNDDRPAWFAVDEPTLVAMEAHTISDMGFEPTQGRLVDAVIRAALATSAGIRIVPAAGPVTDSVAAILRW